ncbi:hypothetical protein FJT64_005764 [Amphibalanus amphitrite]|uniref:Uncharacterized protein n=1 Tax=Amphibalanus amphitrite TaxID=1232801 RepID=A0A6A4VT16_AMPAM|nr:hypothetical protein FJT64_005764 [Amphibalanus amphitrite]
MKSEWYVAWSFTGGAAQEEEARRAELDANAEHLRLQREEQDEDARHAQRAEDARRHQQQRTAARARPASLAARRPADVLSGEQVVEADDVGAMDKVCAACGASRWSGERATLCCAGGKGRLYHRLGPLEAPEDRPPSFAQIYISDPLAEDPEAEAAIRLGHVRLPAATSAAVQHRLLDRLGQLQAMLRQVNPTYT